MRGMGAPVEPYGPYSKKYLGLSKIVTSCPLPGTRFDFVVHPVVVNGAVPVPNTTFPCGCNPWQAAADGSFFSYRYQILPKDRLYAALSFFRLDANAWGVRTRFHNRTTLAQNCMLNYFAALEPPRRRVVSPLLPANGISWHSLAYTQFTYAIPRPWDNLTPDALQKGEFLDDSFTQGHGLGDRVSHRHMSRLSHLRPFGAQAGDAVRYTITAPALASAALVVRYRTVASAENSAAAPDFEQTKRARAVSFQTELGVLTLPYTAALATTSLSLEPLMAGVHTLTLTAVGNPAGFGVELDFFALTEQGNASCVSVTEAVPDTRPQLTEAEDGLYSLRYKDVSEEFCLQVYGQRRRTRLLETGCLEDALPSRLSSPDHTFDDVLNPFSGSFSRKHSDEGYFQNILVSGLYLASGACCTQYAVLSAKPCAYTQESLEQAYRAAKAKAKMPSFNPAGQAYQFSVRCLRSAMLTNVVYPLYRRGEQVTHHAPGKRWDCFYTWDSGFIGLGLVQAEPSLALRLLDQYLSQPQEADFAFVHHGSLVPVQFYLYQALLGETKSRAQTLQLYPSMRRYYGFLIGREEGSVTGRFASGLLTNYDYFYNASGMDDYAAQVLMHQKGLAHCAAPALFTAHVLRAAKILRQSAKAAGFAADEAYYEADIVRLTAALQQAWDADCGYFSYVLHNAEGMPQGFLRTDAGENANKGIDGASPLLSGGCTPDQQAALLAHLQSPTEMLTPVGITAVDQSASYYKDDGYWNGAVWFAHQWFFWKTMLDLGEGAFALHIAQTALDAWKREVDDSYGTFEMLHVATQRGGWFHQFGGLSCPIYLWANAYYRPGTLSYGFEISVEPPQWAADFSACTVALSTQSCCQDALILAVLPQEKEMAHASLNGVCVPCVQRAAGAWEITVPKGVAQGTLCVRAE